MSKNIRRIIIGIIGGILIIFLGILAFVTIQVSQQTQQNLSPDSALAYWCTNSASCPANWIKITPQPGQCSASGDIICQEPQAGGGGSSCTSCDGWAPKGSEQCNPGLNRIYRCSDTCNWIDTGKACSGGSTTPPPSTVCGDNRCEGSENGTNCVQDCGVGGQPGNPGTPAPVNSCSGAGNNSQCGTVGQVVTYGSNNTCICQRSIAPGTTTQCSCVPTSGTSCTSTAGDDGCTSIGSACIDNQNSFGITKTDRAGTCISAGVNNGNINCRCNPAPATGGSCGDGICQSDENSLTCTNDCFQKSCSLDSDCSSGNFCSNGTCALKAKEGNSCSSNNQCLSGLCVGGTCKSSGTGANSCINSGSNCSNPAGGGSDGFCSNGNCIQKGDVNASCVSDLACKSGLSCLSLRCRSTQGIDDSNPINSCISGKWYCFGTSGLTGGAPGQGRLCNNGKLNTEWTVADACAGTSDQKVTNGMSCLGLRRLSQGEALQGKFVGCDGRLNCFCNDFTAQSSVRCIADVGNDSCGASSTQPIITTPPPPPPPPPSSSAYCGDAICQSGEACERTTSNGSTYRACTGPTNSAPSGASVASCFGVELNQPVTTSTCKYCGDGIFTPGREQCDPTAPAGNGNNPTACNLNCTLNQTASQCIDLVENGVDPIRSGAGNFVQYTLIYQNPSTTNPYPNIRLRVGNNGVAVGRDGNNTGNALVAPIPTTGYTFDSVTQRHTYRFQWEAINTSGSNIANGTYDVRVILDGGSEITTPSACTETLQVQSNAEQQPLLNIIKAGTPVCQSNGSVLINYVITARNIGPVSGVVDFVRDSLDTSIISAGITPTNINPSFGVLNSGIITWTGSVADRTFTAGQSKQYTYQILIPQAQVANFSATGVKNQALVQFDTSTTTDNTDSFDVRTPVNCSTTPPKEIPNTGIFDDGRFILIGVLMTITGVYIYRGGFKRKPKRPLVSI